MWVETKGTYSDHYQTQLKDVEIIQRIMAVKLSSHSASSDQNQSLITVAHLTNGCNMGMGALTVGERRSGLWNHSDTYSSFLLTNLRWPPWNLVHVIYSIFIEILDELMYCRKFCLRIYKKVEINRVFNMNKKCVKW